MRLTGQLHSTDTLTLALNITRAVKTHPSFQRSKPLLKSTRNGTPMFFKKNELLLGLPSSFSDIQTEQARVGGRRAHLRLSRC